MAYDFDFEICVVCFRVADMPTPRMSSVRRKCTHCHAPICVAKGAPAAPKACLQCVTRAGASAIRRKSLLKLVAAKKSKDTRLMARLSSLLGAFSRRGRQYQDDRPRLKSQHDGRMKTRR